MAGPRERQRLVAVEHHAAGVVDDQPRVAIAHRRLERQRHAAHRVDDAREAAEVDLDVVVDRDAEVVADRVDQALRTVVVGVGGVDPLVLARARDLDPQVAGERHEVDRVVGGVDPRDHDRVAATPSRFGVVAEERVVVLVALLDHLARVGTDDEVVLGLLRHRLVELEVLALDLVVAIPDVTDAGDGAEDDDHQADATADEQALP